MENKLISKPLEKLCLDCHEQKDIDSAKGHQGMGATPCLKCHDAHAGADQYLLKPELLKAAADPGIKPPVAK